MKILFVSDWHGHDYEVPEEEFDLLVALGDFDWRQIKQLDETYSCPKLGLLGNHDRWDTYKNTNFIHLHKEVFEFNGVRFAGFDGSPRYNFKDAPQFEEDEVEEFVSTLEDVDIFIAHSNPMLTPNFDRSDAHRGFLSFTQFITKKEPSFFVHGHNHEDIQTTLGNTHIISVFPYFVLELSA